MEKRNLGQLIDKIKRDKGFDLSGYRESTISRRIERRMQFDGASSLEEYIRMIDKDYHLYWRLISDFFIGVTDFFRDKEIWEIMREKMLPEIIERKLEVKRQRSKEAKQVKPILRIWSAGCSTGEETHSFAILLHDVLEDSISDFLIYIYGTDIMEDKLEIARKGKYEAEKVEKVEERLRGKYFEPLRHCEEAEGRRSNPKKEIASVPLRGGFALASLPRNDKLSTTRYTLHANLRQLTRFHRYDLVRGEELLGFDIILCRNVLIYFQKHLQEKVLASFHKALNRNGILWLGTAEALSGETLKLFKPIYKNEKIFRKI